MHIFHLSVRVLEKGEAFGYPELVERTSQVVDKLCYLPVAGVILK
jgi:hypothetical protein